MKAQALHMFSNFWARRIGKTARIIRSLICLSEKLETDNLSLSLSLALNYDHNFSSTLPTRNQPSQSSVHGVPVVSSTPISKSVAMNVTAAGPASSGPLSDGSSISISNSSRPLVGGAGKSVQEPYTPIQKGLGRFSTLSILRRISPVEEDLLAA